MIRGTTPTLNFTLPFNGDIFQEIWLTFSQNNQTIFEFDKSNMVIDGKTISVTISQSNTLKLVNKFDVEFQFKCKTNDGLVLASNIMKTSVSRILKDDEI